MSRKRLLSVIILCAGMLAGVFILSYRSITLVVDGQSYAFRAWAFTVQQALSAVNFTPAVGDQITPALSAPLPENGIITVRRAVPVQVWVKGLSQPAAFSSAGETPAEILTLAGLSIAPQDEIWLNGLPIPAMSPLPPADHYVFQVHQASAFNLVQNGEETLVHSARPNLPDALWQAGVRLRGGDMLSVDLDRLPVQGSQVVLVRAAPIAITQGDAHFNALSAAPSLGQALADAGFSLQGLDYSMPSEDSPLAAGEPVAIVRVREEVKLEQKAVAYETEYVADPETPMGQQSVVQAGQYGLTVSRLRLRYENGAEVARQVEDEWTAREPQDQKTGYGTKVVIQTVNTPDGPIEYWRSVEVYATSYSPCNLGTGACSDTTASGAKVSKGIIAVTSAWYRQMAGQRVYVPGYGFAVIADVGGGVPGKYWIDVAYTDAEYVAWHQNVTLYFLTPVPASIPWILP